MSFFKPQTHEAVGSKGMLGGTLCTVSLELLRSVNLEIKRRFLISSLECARFFTISAPIKVEDTISVTASLQKSLPYVDPERTAIWGWSYGGYLRLFSSCLYFVLLFSAFSMVANILKHIFQPFCPHPRHQFSVQLWRQCCTRC